MPTDLFVHLALSRRRPFIRALATVATLGRALFENSGISASVPVNINGDFD